MTVAAPANEGLARCLLRRPFAPDRLGSNGPWIVLCFLGLASLGLARALAASPCRPARFEWAAGALCMEFPDAGH